MGYPNAQIHQKMQEVQVRRLVEAASKGRLLHESGVDLRGFIELVACKLPCGIGTALVKFGRRLQKFDMPVVACPTRSRVPGL